MQRRMKSQEFEAHKESLISEMLGLPSSLVEESDIHWHEIWKHRPVSTSLVSRFFAVDIKCIWLQYNS